MQLWKIQLLETGPVKQAPGERFQQRKVMAAAVHLKQELVVLVRHVAEDRQAWLRASCSVKMWWEGQLEKSILVFR